MRIGDVFPSKFLKAGDLQGQQVKAVIDRVEMDTLGDDTKPVLYFRGKEKGLVLNKTNANNIALVYGDDTDDWIGGEVVMFATMVDFQGRSVEAIRVKVPPQKPQRAPHPADVRDDPRLAQGRGTITSGRTPSAADLVDDDIPF